MRKIIIQLDDLWTKIDPDDSRSLERPQRIMPTESHEDFSGFVIN
jgi:hypothetical protein